MTKAHVEMITVFTMTNIYLFGFLLLSPADGVIYENERIDEFHRRGYVWPPKEEDYVPNTPGWRKLHERRFEQLSHLGADDTGLYDGYMTSVHTGLLCKNFTENGWGLTRAPEYLVELLQQSLYEGLEQFKTHPIYEHKTGVIEAQKLPFFKDNYMLNEKVLHALLPLHEAWSGVKLIPNNAYGLRIYRDGSNLNMHIDKTETHIISSIFHVGHDEDMEPWPIIIEDFQGNTNLVNLEAGDMLFYESSKCLHGRPRKMKEGWYSSLFIHYHPADWDEEKIKMDQHYRVPPGWQDDHRRTRRLGGHEKLKVVDSSVKEPECKDEWCLLREGVEWNGPAPGYGKVLSAGGVVTELKDIPNEEDFAPEEEDL
mmetsp:Transcript_22073/g.44265  ORF Transcript_22073/g.44265 Transcript_22073/m.44265 type:complete len:369 (-) Transcript_22073:440-1546(-)|eukprot:CAMPEP_0194314724 /NCGR_PEP_ID=MMETSP0171-20130528/11577_1 /TAXON_ID=218684 /ORGANISM="Corethron pennatum, Strain L29A3" /LENGTH=368 /DNA_ID=CAMNT_0039070277 /DNA_START=149 /DNA_END=1255 /DNA_ORIENTATION=+